MARTSSLLSCLLLAVVSVFLATPAAATAQGAFGNSLGCFWPSVLPSGLLNVTINGTERQFIVRLSKNYRPHRPSRVVIALHWFGGTMNDVVAESTKYGNGSFYGLQRQASDSTIFVAPQGLSNAWFNTNGADIAFIDALVATIDLAFCVDTSQRFVVGFSFGGSLANALANSRGRLYRAVAVLSGTDFVSWTGETVPVSFFVSHGVSDPANPIAKGRLMRDRFIEVNGCVNATAPEPAAGSLTHIKTEFKRCWTGHLVTYIAFDGVHQYSPLDAGATTSWLPNEIWKFFLNAPAPCAW